MIRSNNSSIQNFIKGVNISNKYDYEDPTYLGFKVMFNFNDKDKSPLFNENPSDSNSAINYLNNVNRQTESKLITRFKNVLYAVSTDYDYMLQSISGLGAINNWIPGQNFRAKDLVLNFECLESIDQKMNYLMHCYLSGAYDWRYMRSLIPYNLQFFSMTIMVYEIRNFRTLVQTAATESVVAAETGNTRSIPSDSPVQSNASAKLAGNLPTQIYMFDYCTFDFNDSQKYLDTISNADINDPIKFQFKIKVGRIREKFEFPLFGTIIEPLIINSTHNFSVVSNEQPGQGRMSDANPLSLKPLYGTTEKKSSVDGINTVPNMGDEGDKSFKDKATSRIKSEFKSNAGILASQANNLANQATNLPNTLGNQIANNLFSRVKGLSLGNVYDFRNQPLTSTLQALASRAGIPNLGNVFNDAADQVFKPAKDISNLGNLYKK